MASFFEAATANRSSGQVPHTMRLTACFTWTALFLSNVDRASAFSPNQQSASRACVQCPHFSKENFALMRNLEQQTKNKVTTLKATSSEESEGFFNGLDINFRYALPYIGFLAIGYFMTTAEAPGASQVVLEKFIVDPISPGVNELFASIFNLLGTVALPMACLLMPGAKGQKLPAAPFLAGSVFAGYGSVGIFMSTRKAITEVSRADLGWVTKNVLENKIFNWFLVVLILSAYTSTGFASAMLADPASEIKGYQEMFSSTAICSVSSLDLSILTLTMASLVPEDLKRRGVEDSNKANAIAASTILLPVLGAALFCALRPSLPEE